MHKGLLTVFALPWLMMSIPLYAGEAAAVNLAQLSAWDIVVAGDCLPSERYAAEQFQSHVELATGWKLPIVETPTRPDRHVFIGPSQAMRASEVGFDTQAYGEEDLRIVVRDGNIAIAGGRPRGTLYGVYTFLEDYFGVRFLTADHTHVPPVGDWRVVGPVDRIYRPPLAMRWSYYGETNRNPTFAARLRNNTVTNDATLGGVSGVGLINHSFYKQIDSKTYGTENPEYYCEIDGKRLAQVNDDAYDNEPCLTNPDVLRIVTEKLLAQIKENPGRKNFSVSQNDNNKYCRCADCAAIDGREGTPMGTLLTFVNAVADQVAAKHPDVWIGTLSYWYSRQPPKTIKPRPNVQIQLASIECCLIHPINDPDCACNVRFCQDMTNWSALTDKVSIWNYNTNFSNYLLPCPNLRVIEPNVRFFMANHARGIFMQAAGNAQSTELSDLRNYLISSLLWDPNRSGRRLIDEFLCLHYGAAAPPIQRYIDLIHDAAEESGVHRDCFAARATDYGIDPALAGPALAFFDEALQLAETDAVRERVEKASIAAYRLAIEPVWIASGPPVRIADPASVDPQQLNAMRPQIQRFVDLCGRHGVDRVRDSTQLADVQTQLEQLVNYRGDQATN